MNPYFSNYSWCPNSNQYFVPQSYSQQRGLIDQAPYPASSYNYWQHYQNFMTVAAQRYHQQWCHRYRTSATFYQPTSAVKNESSKPSSSKPCHNSQQLPKSYVCYPDQADQKPQLVSQVDICEIESNSTNEYSLISDPDMDKDGDVTMSDINDKSLVVHEDKRQANTDTDDLNTVNGNLSPCKEKQKEEVPDEEFLAMCKKNMDELLDIQKKFIAVKDKFESLMLEETCDSL